MACLQWRQNLLRVVVHEVLSAIEEFPRRESRTSRYRPPQNLEIPSPGTSGAYTSIFFTLTRWLGNPRDYQLLQVRAHFSSCLKPCISARPWNPLYLLFIQKCYRTDRPKSYSLWATGDMFPATRSYIVRGDIWNEKTSFKHFPEKKTEIELRDYF